MRAAIKANIRTCPVAEQQAFGGIPQCKMALHIWRPRIGARAIRQVEQATLRFRRASGRHRIARYVRGGAAICVLAMIAPVVAPLAASRSPLGLTIILDPPLPYGASADPVGRKGIPVDGSASQPQTPGFSPTLLVPGPAAKPFLLAGSAQDRMRASLCLTSAIYYEAGQEPDEGQRAVAQVILNRVRHPAYPGTICGVVYQGTERADALCQFSFGCDGSGMRLPASSAWARAWRNAQAALSGAVYAPVGLATHYHTLAVNPTWSRALTPAAIVGAHIFFRWPGGAGAPAAFYASYRGSEPLPAPSPKPFAPAIPLVWPRSASSARVANLAPVEPVAADRSYAPSALPESSIREEYRNSGTWKIR